MLRVRLKPHPGRVGGAAVLGAMRFAAACGGAASNTSADQRAAQGKRRIFKAGDPELKLDVEGLNGFAAMMATMKEMGARKRARACGWALTSARACARACK